MRVRVRGSWLTVAVVCSVLCGVAFHPAVAAGQEPALVAAVKRSDTKAVDTLLKAKADVNVAHVDGTTALHWAAHNGDLATVDRLLAAGARPGAVNRYGVAPLWQAAQNGHGKVVESLLRAGADANQTRGESGETALMIAARAGHVEVLLRLVAHGADVNVKDNIRGQTALIWAAGEGHAEAIRVLAKAGADLEFRSQSGMTPLMFAVRSSSLPSARELLDQGADLKAAGKDGTTMLSIAIVNNNWEMAALLVERGADVNGNDPVHGRPLHTLAFARRAINRGLSGVLPRQASGAMSSLELAEVLVAKGARVNDRIDWRNPNHNPPHMSMPFFFTISYVGATPFFIAAKTADLELMKFLLANGADPQIPTAQKVTPFLAAAGVGYSTGETPESVDEALEAVKFLQALGSDLNAVTDFSALASAAPMGAGGGGGGGGGGRRAAPLDGAGALHGAVSREAPEIVKWLLSQNVPVDQKSKNGQTALDIVFQYGLGTTQLTREVIGAILREAMIAKGLPVPPPPRAGL